jgi:hypothetical protein
MSSDVATSKDIDIYRALFKNAGYGKNNKTMICKELKRFCCVW